MKDVTLVLEADEDKSGEIKAKLEAASNTEAMTAKRESLDGTLSTVLTILQVASPIMSVIAPVVVEIIRGRKVKRIKFNDIEIDNPTEQQWTVIWQKFEAQPSKPAP